MRDQLLILQLLSVVVCQEKIIASMRQQVRQVTVLHAQVEEQTKKIKALETALSEFESIEQELKTLKDYVFGQRSEKSPPEEDPEEAGEQEDADPKEISFETVGSYQRKKRRKRSDRLPPDIPRIQIIYDIPETRKTCACGCGQLLKKIGEEVTEQLCIIPEKMYVKQHIQYKYAGCPHESGVITAPKIKSPIPKSIASPEIIAHTAVNKFEDHLPLYRQEKRYGRYDIDIARQVQCDWLIKAAEALEPMYQLIKQRVFLAPIINTDDTPIPVQNKGAGKTKTGRLWVYASHGDDIQPYVIYDYTEDRTQAHPQAMFAGYGGYIQADAYPGYDALFLKEQKNSRKKGDIIQPSPIENIDGDNPIKLTPTEVGCMMHCRRKFFTIAKQSKKKGIAYEAVQRIKGLYAIEKRAKEEGLDSQARYTLRQQEAKSLVDAFFAWLEEQKDKVLPQSPTAKAIQYALNNKKALMRYLDNGMLEIDNGWAERLIKPTTIGRKNYMFFGSDRGGVAGSRYYSLIESAKLHGLKTHEYISDLLFRLPMKLYNKLEDLLPHQWKPLELDLTKPVIVEELLQSFGRNIGEAVEHDDTS